MPLVPPATAWIAALDHDSVEVRLAVGLASVGDSVRPAVRRERSLPALRDYLHGTGRDVRGRRHYDETTAGCAPSGAGAIERLAAVHARRFVDATREDRMELGFEFGVRVGLGDLSLLVAGQVDERLLGGLVDGLALLDYGDAPTLRRRPTEDAVDPLLALLALAFHDPRRATRSVSEPPLCCRPRSDWVARLRAGRTRAVAAEALLRLRIAGLTPLAEPGDLQTAAASGPRLAAALLARPGHGDLRRAVRAATFEVQTPEQQEART